MYKREDDLASVEGNKGDIWLISTWTGPGRTSTFMYALHENKLLVLEKAPSYFHSEDKETYKVYKMKLDGKDEEKICTIESSSPVMIEGENIIWYNNGTCNEMPISEPYDVKY